MRSILRFPPAPCASIASGLFLVLVPLAARAAEQLARDFEPGTTRFWFTLAAVQVLWAIGYAASSLPAWAKWQDGTRLDRLTIVQGVVVAGMAGNICYYGAFYYMGAAEIASFICSGLAGFGGDKFLAPLIGRLHTAFDAFTGRNNGAKP